METIIYQGREIQAAKVNYISGAITTSTVDHEGDEDLFRDEAGRYYLRRQLSRLDSEGECRPASGRTHVHRVGINAAILWATTRLNSETLDLRRDAAAMLMENRGYDDPDTTRARYIRGIFKRQELVEPATTSGTRHFADGSMTVTLHLKPEPARLFRAACELEKQTLVESAWAGLRAQVQGILETRGSDVEAIFADNAPDEEGADDQRTVINLLHEDGRLYARVPLEPDLEATLEEKAREEGTNIGTALLNCLSRFHQQPPAAPDDTTELTTYGVSQSTLEAAACYAAKHGRTLDQFIVDCLELAADDDPVAPEGSREAKTPGTVSPASAGPVAPVVEEPQPGVRRFTFDYSASRWLAARRRTVELTDEQMGRARELAATFGLELTAFLRGLVDRNDLPGQRCYPDAKVYNLLQPEHIGFVCTDVAIAQRIERAAQSRGESVEEFVAHALGGDVDTWEECMLLHPTTGDLLDTDYEELYTEVKCDILTAPLGQEDERSWKLSIGKERVNFGVFLRPDQVEKVKYPHMVFDEESGREVPCVLIPLDPEGNPVLRVGSRYVEPGEAIPREQAASQAAPGFADLDDNARELLAKHLAKDPELDARDVLNGAVTFLLSDEVDWTGDAKEEARNRRLAQEATGKRHVALCALLDDEAAALVRRYLKVSPWEFTAADIINACVVHALKQAFEDVAPLALEGELDAEEYDESGWGYVEADIVAATRRRTGKEAVDQRLDWSKQEAEAELEPEMTEYSTGLNKVRSGLNLPPRGSRGAKPNPADVALLAASAPGEEPLPEEVHTDEPGEGAATLNREEGK